MTQRNWSSYNLAQTSEKLLFLRMLNDVVNYLNISYEYKGNGRPPIGVDDMIKCCVIKVFNNFSSRRTMAELKLAYALQYIREVPHFNSINNYMQKEEMMPYLHNLYKLLALPLVDIETTFAVDATGIGTMQKKHWVEMKFARGSYKIFRKLHIISGIRTNIVTSAKVTSGHRHDSPYFEGMVRETSDNFRIREVCADTGYLSRHNCKVASEVGASPFILPAKNTQTESYIYNRKATAWLRMLEFWKNNRELFLQHYHKRSNVESTFSALKRKFLPYVRSKNEQAQFNEILCKVVCHNASVLCTAMFELDVDINFGEIVKVEV